MSMKTKKSVKPLPKHLWARGRKGQVICQCGKGYGSELDGLCFNCRGMFSQEELERLVELARADERAQRKPLTVWTEAQHERAYRNSPEMHEDVQSLAAFKRVAKEIAAMYGIKENT